MNNNTVLYPSLEAQSLVILNNLSQLDPMDVEEIIAAIERTSASVHIDVYKKALEFYRYSKEKKWPDINYLRSQFGEAIRVIDEPNFTFDFVAGFILECKMEITSTDVRMAALNRDFKTAGMIIEASGLEEQRAEEFTEDDALEEYKIRRENPSGILLDVPEIDEFTHGICYGNPCVVGGGPGSGKSTFAISATYGALMKNFNCVYISTELSKPDLMFNFLSRHSYEMNVRNEIGAALKADRIKKATLTDKEYETFNVVREDFKNCKRGKLRLYSGSDFTPFSPIGFRHEMNTLLRKWGYLDLIVLDYVQNCVVWKNDPRQDVTQFLNSLVEYLRAFSVGFNKHGVCLMILSQLNREGVKKIQRSHSGDLTCFAELNTLERCAHTAILVHSDATTKLRGQTMMQIIKNRSGESMAEMRNVNFEPMYFKVGGGAMNAVLNEESLGEMSDEVNGNAFDSMF